MVLEGNFRLVEGRRHSGEELCRVTARRGRQFISFLRARWTGEPTLVRSRRS